MQQGTVPAREVDALIQQAVRGELDAEALTTVCKDAPEIVCLALLAAARRIAVLESAGHHAASSPSTPSGMVPIYTKPNQSKRRSKKPGGRKGHQGFRRERPTRIDDHKTHRLDNCPHCQGQLQRCSQSRTRVIEDIPEEIKPVVTEHTIHRDYCPNCKKHVEPVVPDAMPKAALGHNVIALASWFHYGLGLTIDQVVDILGYHLQTKLTPGGLIDAWHRLALVLITWYEQIAEDAKASSHLHADAEGDQGGSLKVGGSMAEPVGCGALRTIRTVIT